MKPYFSEDSSCCENPQKTADLKFEPLSESKKSSVPPVYEIPTGFRMKIEHLKDALSTNENYLTRILSVLSGFSDPSQSDNCCVESDKIPDYKLSVVALLEDLHRQVMLNRNLLMSIYEALGIDDKEFGFRDSYN